MLPTADVLLVAAEVGDAESRWIEDVDEAGLAAAMLDVGPASLADGGHVEAVAEADEGLLVGPEYVACRTEFFHTGILATAAVFFLLFFDERGEGQFGKASSHLWWCSIRAGGLAA